MPKYINVDTHNEYIRVTQAHIKEQDQLIFELQNEVKELSQTKKNLNDLVFKQASELKDLKEKCGLNEKRIDFLKSSSEALLEIINANRKIIQALEDKLNNTVN